MSSNNHPPKNGRKKIGLALGGGVARGPAHIGVLAALEEANIPIDYIAGTSAGALIGAAYCAGLSISKLKELASRTGWWNVTSFRPTSRGLFSYDKLASFLTQEIGDFDLRDLAIPLTITTTEIATGQPIYLREGSMTTAVCASCAVPGIVEPIPWQNKLLCDGGISDNLPVQAVRNMGADYVIAVDLFTTNFTTRYGPLGVGANAVERMVRQAGGGIHHADCLIIPDIADASFIRFSKGPEHILEGEKATRNILPRLHAALAQPTNA